MADKNIFCNAQSQFDTLPASFIAMSSAKKCLLFDVCDVVVP